MTDPAQRQTTTTTPLLPRLTPQTGMPAVYHKRSKEVFYDSLQTEATFIRNPWSPQLLSVSRPQYHW